MTKEKHEKTHVPTLDASWEDDTLNEIGNKVKEQMERNNEFNFRQAELEAYVKCPSAHV